MENRRVPYTFSLILVIGYLGLIFIVLGPEMMEGFPLLADDKSTIGLVSIAVILYIFLVIQQPRSRFNFIRPKYLNG